jgi:predicted lipoprotein with Yx(FWY)xxD motif
MIRRSANGATTTKRMAVGAGLGLAAVVISACGSSSSGGSNVTSGGQPTAGSTSDSGGSSSPATSFSVANVSGLGKVLVDGRGHTVYVLTKNGTKNATCTDENGCTAIWPDLSFPDGVHRASAGNGVNAAMLKSKNESDGETYATYNGWLLYEYSGDSAAGQTHGEGVNDQWGTWYALTPAGAPVTAKTTTASTSSSSSGGGYGY